MTTKAYILMQTEVGKQRVVVDAVRSFPGVREVDAIHGPYDVIAVIEAPNLIEVGELVSDQIHRVNGVLHTVTCLAMSVPPSP